MSLKSGLKALIKPKIIVKIVKSPIATSKLISERDASIKTKKQIKLTRGRILFFRLIIIFEGAKMI